MSLDRTTGALAPRAHCGPSTPTSARTIRLLVSAAGLLLAGCTLTPPGADEEAERLAEVGKAYEPKYESRAVPELPDRPDWRDVLRRSFLANGDVEAAYFRWKAAVERVGIEGAYPNSDVSLGYEYMFSGGKMKAYDRSTFSAGFDSAMPFLLPGKVEQAAKIALDEAKAAGEAFRVAKFDLQRDVLQAWADYTLQAQTIRLREQDLSLRRVMLESAAGAARAGGRVRETLAADLELRTDEGMLADVRAEHEATRMKLNALMGRAPEAPLPAPEDFPPARTLPDDDLVMVKAAADMFPEVAVMMRETEGRADALELARMRWIPDVSPSFAFTGSLSQSLGAMLTLPTTIPAIRGRIREAEADLRASEAILRQRTSDRVGEYFTLVVMYRNAERQARLFETSLLPAATRLAEDQARAYSAGAAMFADVVEARRTLLNIRQVVASSRAAMDKALVEIECCLGVDIERVGGPEHAPQPSPEPRPEANPAPAEPEPLAARPKEHRHDR